MGALCAIYINKSSQNFDYWCIKGKRTYTYHGQEAKLKSGTSSILNSLSQNPQDLKILCNFKLNVWFVESI